MKISELCGIDCLNSFVSEPSFVQLKKACIGIINTQIFDSKDVGNHFIAVFT